MLKLDSLIGTMGFSGYLHPDECLQH